MTEFIIRRPYVYFFLVGLILVEASVPHLLGLKSSYLFLIAILIFLFPRFLQLWNEISLSKNERILTISYFTYLIFCLSSVIWSESKASTVIHSTLLISSFFYALALSKFEIEKTIDILQRIILVCIGLSWFALILNSEYALQQKGIWRLRGIFFHEFELGFLCSTLIIILCLRWCQGSINKFYKRPINFYIIFCIAFATLLSTQTRTLLAYTFLTCVISLLVLTKGKKKLIAYGIFILGCIVAVALQDSFLEAFSRGESDMTLSGRTVIWDRAIAIADRAPVLGHGFGSFNNPKFDSDFTGFFGSYRAPHAHNSWIMAYFETGVVGTVLLSQFLLVQLAFGIKLAFKTDTPPYGLFLALIATLGGMTSLIYGGNVASLAFIPFALLLQESQKTKRI